MANDPTPEPAPEEMRVLVLPPTSRDAQAIGKLLAGDGIPYVICPTMSDLCSAVARGAAAVIVSEEALVADSKGLSGCLDAQSVWSDLPIIVLARSGMESPKLAMVLPHLGNVSVIERPVRITTFLSLVRSAIRGRQRQYQVRAHLTQQQQAEEELRASDEQMRLAVQTGKLGVWEVDLRTNQMRCSPTCKINFGRAPDASFTYEELWASIHPDDLERVQKTVRESVDRRVEYDLEYRIVWPDGSLHWILARGRPSFTADQNRCALSA